MASNICRSSVWNMLHVILLSPRILRCLLIFLKIFVSLDRHLSFTVKTNQPLYSPWRFQETEAPRFHDNRLMKQSFQPYAPAAFTPQEIFLILISVKRLGRPQGHSAAGRIMSMKNSTIGDWTRDLPACSAQPQPAAQPVPQCFTVRRK
jgi:hypothetical protein